MKNNIYHIGRAALLICLFVTFATSQTKHPLVAPLEGGGSVAISLKAEPAGTNQPFAGMISVEFDNVIHRVLMDRAAGYFFGYDLVVKRLPELRQFSVVVRPLDREMDRSMIERAQQRGTSLGHPDSKMISPFLMKESAPQLIDDGGIFAIDLLVNPDSKAKISDVVKVSFDDLEENHPNNPYMDRTPRDFTLDDVQLTVNNYELTLNGRVIATKLSFGFSGPIIWFSMPGKGRFIFSVKPHEGYNFQKVAIADHNKLSFTVDGDQFVWSSTSPIIGMGGTWNIWLLRESDSEQSSSESGQPVMKKKAKADNASNDRDSAPGMSWGRAWRMEDLAPKKN